MTLDVQHWLDHPSENFGWLLRGDDATAQTAKRFLSSGSASADFRPQLILEFSPVPEISSCAGLLAGLAWTQLARRRRWKAA